jgi:hypothetical protein
MKSTVPNWQHHSRKVQKRRLKPQALRQAKARVKAMKRRFREGHPSSPFSVCGGSAYALVATVRTY